MIADALELEESGQFRLGVDGEQRALDGFAAPVTPAPLNHTPERTAAELAEELAEWLEEPDEPPMPKRSNSKPARRKYHCAYCQRELKPDAWIYSRATGARYCPPTDPRGCNTPTAYARQERARALKEA